MQQLAEVLGPPPRPADREAFAELERAWGLQLPDEMATVLSAYGDCRIAGHVNLFGPHTLKHANAFFGPQISDIAEAGGQPRLGQQPGQLLLWGTTVDGDVFTSEIQPGPQWATVYFNGLTLDWGRDEAGFAHWLHRAQHAPRSPPSPLSSPADSTGRVARGPCENRTMPETVARARRSAVRNRDTPSTACYFPESAGTTVKGPVA